LGWLESRRPDFVVPVYPVVTFTDKRYMHKRSRKGLIGEWHTKEMNDSLSIEHHVKYDTPRAFIVNCVDDPIVKYQNSELLDSALTAKGIEHRYIQYKTGGHGFGASDEKGTEECRQWRGEFLEWLKSSGRAH
jgi:acetyl esterase/lipase